MEHLELHLYKHGSAHNTREAKKRSIGPSNTTNTTPTIVGDKSLETGWLFIEKLDAQLHVALVSLCRGEALTVAKN